ncbi:MAG TPA: aminotransferase [Deltaproteobacteria bacterium]|nr:aminotransferase [Deltaproteobacteria bacterium]HCP48178.1 aminotransferase [Deltaproteobacteria bacterium]
MTSPPLIDCRDSLPSGETPQAFAGRALNEMTGRLGGSRILHIAGQIKAMQAEGHDIANFTVGDFSPKEFRVPERLSADFAAALSRGETNYPPAVGLPEVRQAVANLYERELGLKYNPDSVIMGSGARPPIYATAALVVEPGDRMLFGIPSWNNPYYVQINSAQAVAVPTGPESDFLLTADTIAPHLDGVTLLCLNSPLNPCGTAFSEEQLGAICDVVLTENATRATKGERPIMVMYDQVYWMLCFGDTKHHTPVSVRPEMAPYTIFVDAISKSFAATGLRVGWAVVPEALAPSYKALIGHMGAWAPRPAQVATALLLNDPDAITAYHATMKNDVEQRLRALHDGFTAMGGRGLPVRSIAPQGAIYLSVHFDVLNRSWEGRTLSSDDDVRTFLLEGAGIGLVPFQAFGLTEDTGWMRFSVGAVSMDDIEAGLHRIEQSLCQLS